MKLLLFFAGEKLFPAALLGTQNDLVYAPVATKHRDVSASRLLRAYAYHFQQIRKISVAVLKLAYVINLVFIEYGAKSNRQYYQQVLLVYELLRMICSVAEKVFAFHEDIARTHRAHDVTLVSLIVICDQPT